MSEPQTPGSDGEDPLPSTLSDPLEAYLYSKGKGPSGSTGTYRRNAERELRHFARFLVDRDITELEEIDVRTLRAYVRPNPGSNIPTLLERDLSPRTVRKYYDYVSAWIGWAQREGLVPEHYGIQESAREPLPDVDTRAESGQQSWQRDQRQALLSYVDDEAHAAIEAEGLDAYGPVRDRALVYLLAYSGLRGSELLANRDDDRRDGAEWDHLGDELASIEVLGKTQSWEYRAIPPQARPAIEQWRRVYDPEPDWPIVPSFHYPTLYDGLRDAGVEDTESLSGYADVFEAYREAGARPVAMTTDGGRRLLRRLTDEAGVDVDDGYLKLHGARRGVGRVLAMQQGADAAADQLGNSVTVVEERYSDILASERAEETGEAFEMHDQDKQRNDQP